jgi:soluble lytic murein transglycosylase-like protein
MKVANSLLCLIAAVLIPLATSAGGLPFDNCFTAAAQRYSVDKRVLVAIAQTESRMNPNIIGPTNANGSYDIGVMQINSGWLSSLAKHGISQGDLREACTNIHVGAWILASNIKTHGPTWKAIGAYNATTPAKQLAYVYKVQRNYLLVGSYFNS